MEDQTTQPTTEAPAGSSEVKTISSAPRPVLIPYVLIIILLILSNIFFGLTYLEDDDDDDPDPDDGNGVEPRTPIRANLTVLQSYNFILNNTNNTAFVIIDVRPPSDYEAGHIPGAIHLDYFNDSFERYIAIFDKNHTYLVYCFGGQITTHALDYMEAVGYSELYHLLNGFDRWKELGYEVEGGDS